jgi:flagellum-specific peptidoglycan hydrolase FlgJ
MDVNNIFGLWDSRKKQYFAYDTWEDSIGGYLRGIQYRFNKEKYEDYYAFLLDIGYAEDPEYISKLKKLVDGQ